MAAQRRAMREAEEELKRKMAANGGKSHVAFTQPFSHLAYFSKVEGSKKRCVKSGAVAQTHAPPSCATGDVMTGRLPGPREVTNGVKVQGRKRCIYLLSHTSVLVASSANPVIPVNIPGSMFRSSCLELSLLFLCPMVES